jgi:hypothetical protein
MIKLKYLLYFSFVASFFLLSLASCKKEYAKTAYKDIETFTVTDSVGNQLKGSVIGDSVRIYWPPFQSVPASIKPQIILSSGASINPASGADVAFKKGTVYTVTAQDGSKKIYYLIPMINQPAPLLDPPVNGAFTIPYLSLQGQYFIPDTNQTKLYLVNSSNKSIPISLKNATSFNSLGITVNLPVDGSIDTGYYKIKLVSGLNTIVKGPYHFAPPEFLSSLISCTFNEAGKTLKAGDEISFNYAVSKLAEKYYPGKISNLQLLIRPVNGAEDGSEDLYYEITLAGQDQHIVHYKLPIDISSGKISLAIISYELNNGEIGTAYVWDAATEPTTSISN